MDSSSFYKYKISEDIIKALNGLEYYIPTNVQAKVIPSALEKNDLIVKAQTGSGKTGAYAIPICELIEWLENKPQALILTPTRELAVQIKEDFINIGRFKRVKATAIYGGHPFSVEKAELKQKTHVVVGTPGRVMDHIKKGTLTLSKMNYLVIDEADRMFDMGFASQVEAILKELPGERMTMLFSATMNDEVKSISSKHMKDPIHVDVSETSIMTAGIKHFLYITNEEDKFELLTDVMIIEKPDSSIIFCSTKDRVDMVCSRLNDAGYPCNKMHGGMEQDERISAMRRFKRGEYRYLIATDVMARGIDIENISLVINYDIPLDEENYIHRTGRTGRAGQKGKAISFVNSAQTRYLHAIEEQIGFKIQELTKPAKEEVSIQKPFFDEKINMASQIRKMKSDQLNKEIMKLRFNGGRNKKLRATNFVGVISNLEGVRAEDIGIISMQDTLTYIEILNGKGSLVLEAMKNTKICGKQLKVIEVMDKI
ncbi:ATP-dependent RNA helicase DbpA [Anaerocolumna cellulosilytica]|uniref:ATP-dependent RNA helicase DbpA n=1 Tax=Anaerocolumna cellulosilytica TaxID=433286 RepID=A0A6S6R283_9FIRM|nr:DEAD/DEAH box helicase [Anaerocolumna cellulosilytica]MBB5194850.1 superfamily II DNA/RNA helicase [Anaerocolumna cellulosilytica]BCJ94187.1 ATP-dependent RNA helicase DbpA [Anaerocolumna cellulosilytica]